MSRTTKAQLEARIAVLEAQLAEREERLVKAREEYVKLRDVLRASRPAPRAERVVEEYVKRDGTRWQRVEVGFHQYAHRQVH